METPSQPPTHIYEILTLLAIVLGPIIAVQVQKYLERSRDLKNRKLYIFKTLMATRGSVLSFAHVEALNRIDLEFSGDRKYLKVISSWKEYFDNLLQKAETQEELIVWSARNEELLANLLFEMGLSLGYDFDKVLIKRNVYSPVGHFKTERENEIIRQELLKILQGNATLPIRIDHVELSEDAIERQTKLQNLMIEYYQSNKKTDEQNSN